LVEEGEGLGDEVVEGGTAHVVADHAVVGGEGFDLRQPHLQVRAECVAQQHGWAAGSPSVR
jgi:hypothetical protein